MQGWKVTTHDLRPPVRDGEPIWSGSVPFDLPEVTVDLSEAECASGWNFCELPSSALRISGLWPNGRPSRLWLVEANDSIHRGDKLRAATLRIVREATSEEIADAVRDLSQAFGEHAEEMAREQLAWREALGRPLRDEDAVESGLKRALAKRGLSSWSIQRYSSVSAAGAFWDAWDAGASWDAWDAGASWDARAAGASWAARDAWAAWDARAAWDAISVKYAAMKGWVDYPRDLLTAGIRDAYRHGLGVAVPIDDGVLGWSMEEEKP